MATSLRRALFVHSPPPMTLSGGDWIDELPLKNLLEERMEFIARSRTVSPLDTRFDAALAETTDLAAVYIGWTNCTPAARVRASFWPTLDMSAPPAVTTGWLEGLVPAEADEDRSPSIYIILDSAVAARAVWIEIEDPFNPSGYLDIASFFVGPFFQPSINYGYEGNNLRFIDRAVVATSLNGEDLVRSRAEPRAWRGSFDHLPEAELFGAGYDFLRSAKRGSRVLFIADPGAAPALLQRMAFLGRVTERDGLSQTSFARGGAGLTIQEFMGRAPATSFGVVLVLPLDKAYDRDYPILTGSGATLEIPTDSGAIHQFVPGVLTGVALALPTDTTFAHDYLVQAGGGVALQIPVDVTYGHDFPAMGGGGAAMSLPPDILEQFDIAPTIATGVILAMPMDATVQVDIAPFTGQAVVLQIPTDTTFAHDYLAQAGGGASVAIPVDVTDQVEFAPTILTGAVLTVPVDNAAADDAAPRIPAFSSGFNFGFR